MWNMIEASHDLLVRNYAYVGVLLSSFVRVYITRDVTKYRKRDNVQRQLSQYLGIDTP